jgi:hypothetical protein
VGRLLLLLLHVAAAWQATHFLLYDFSLRVSTWISIYHHASRAIVHRLPMTRNRR